jgi:hypothetical protein
MSIEAHRLHRAQSSLQESGKEEVVHKNMLTPIITCLEGEEA